MTENATQGRPVCTVLIQRGLGDHTTGSASYLITFLRETRAAGFELRLVLAPERSFGNRPWGSIHPSVAAFASRIDWPRSVRIGGTHVSLAPRVYVRFAIRLVQEALRRLGIGGRLAEVRSLLGHEPWPDDAEAMVRLASTPPAHLVVAEYSSVGPLLERVPDTAHKAVLLHDLFSLRAAALRAAGYEPDFEEMSLEAEAARCRAAGILFFASASERDALTPLLPGTTAVWVRPDVGEQSLRPGEGPARAVFIGTRHAGNRDALHLVCEQIWPAVLKARPGAELHVVGSIGADVPASAANLAGLTIHGRVDDLAAFSGPSWIGLAPTQAASGVSIKVAEYMRLGMSVIAMPAALDGFGRELDDLLVCEKTPDAFAAAVVRLLSDDVERHALAARGLAEIGLRLSNAGMRETLERLAATRPGA